MLAVVAKKVSEENLLVENITTELRMDDRTGTRNFVINCDCTAAHKMTKEEPEKLFEDFNVLKREVDLDVVDLRIHVGK